MTRYKVSAVITALITLLACSNGSTPVKLGGISLRLADGTPISQAAADDYSPHIVKMADGHLVLVFGSDRSCAGCTGGNHNIFITRSVTAYNDDQNIPAFNSPAVLTLASTPLNLTSPVTFAATQAGSNLRIYLNNAQGVIQYADFAATSGTFNVTNLTSIVNAVWRKLTIAGIDELGSGIYGRNTGGQVYWFNPGIINLTLNPMSGLNYTSVTRLSPSQSGIADAFFTVRNGTANVASYAGAAGQLTDLMAAADQARVTINSLSIMSSGDRAGDFIVLSATTSGQTLRDLYVGYGLTPAQLWEAGGKPSSGITSLPAAVTGIYAWYELDGNRNDTSGSGNNAFLPTTPFNGADPTYTGSDRHGLPNAVATFNGSTQYIGNNFVAKCDENFSISLWLKPAQVTALRSILGYQPSPSANPGFMINQTAASSAMIQAFYIADGFNVSNTTGIGGTLNAGQWQHIAVVHDSVTRLGMIYLNGTVVATSANAGSNCGGPCTCSLVGNDLWWFGTPMTIGYAYSGFFQGDLDQVAFFNRKLTAAEIQVLAAQ